MRGFFRLTLCAGLGGVIFIGAGRACPTWTARLGLDSLGLAALEEQMARERQRSAELDRLNQLVYPRLVAKYQVTAALAAGRLSLLEAAARFRALDQMAPGHPPAIFHSYYAGSSDEERYCRQAIQLLRASRNSASEQTALAEQLEAELSEHLAHGTLHLPESGPR
jgi:hypothetical protein